MLTELGHEVILYAGPAADAPVAEHVTVVTADDRARWFGDTDWAENVFNDFDPQGAPWSAMNDRTIAAMRDRLRPRDVVFLTMGSAQAPIQQAFPNHLVAECGIGYSGVLTGTHKCFESAAWMHYIWGRTGVDDGRWFDVVIPNAYDPDEYLFGDGGDYLLFMGRLTERKGLEVVRRLAERRRVITAGPGDERIPGAEHVGVVRGTEKAALLAGARALLVPSQYIGPFEGVNVEAQMSGTPVLTTDFGAFTETVEHGKTGFRCRTLGEFLAAVDQVDDLNPQYIRDRAVRLYGTEVVAPQYDEWLRQLQLLYGEGWYSLEPFRGKMPRHDLLDRAMPETSLREDMVQGASSAVAPSW